MQTFESEITTFITNLETLSRNGEKLSMIDKSRIASEITDFCDHFDMGSNPAFIEFLSQDYVRGLLASARDFMTDWEVYLEQWYGTGHLGCQGDPVDDRRDYYVGRYRKLVPAEMALCSMNPQIRVCHVGCGAMPLSVLMWHRYSGAVVIGIDRDRQCIERAQQVIEDKLKSDRTGIYNRDKITATYADGSDFSYEPFDIVVLSSSIQSKASVLERIASTGRRNLRLLERVPRGLWRYLIYWEEHSNPFFITQKVVETGSLEIRSFALSSSQRHECR